MRMMFEQLRELTSRWPDEEVEEAFGSRDDLEERLRAATAADGDEATMGIVQLWYGSAHQSALFPVAPRMPELLIALLDERPAAVQVQALMGLARHAEPHCYHVGYPGLLPQVFEFGQARPSAGSARESTDYERLCLRTWQEVARHANRYAELLSAREPEVVAASLYVLSLLKEWPEGARDRVRTLADAWPVVDGRAGAWMALGLHAWSLGGAATALSVPPLTDAAAERSVRVAQAIAAAHNHAADARLLLPILADGARLPRLVFDRYPWCAGAIAGPAAEAMTILSDDLEAEVVDALLAALRHHHGEGAETCEDQDWEWPVPELVSEHLVRFAFREWLGRKDELTREEMTPLQHRILTVLYEVGCHPAALTHAGVRRLSKRLVGLEAPGPLDRPLTMTSGGVSRAWPIWKWWWLALRSEVAEDELVQALEAAYAPRDLADIALDMTRGDYDIMSRTPRSPVPLAQRLMDRVAGQTEPYLRERADALLRDDEASVSTIAVVMLPLLRFWHERREPIDWTYEPLLRRLAGQGRSLREEVGRFVPRQERSRLRE